jgi:hypothetical protein
VRDEGVRRVLAAPGIGTNPNAPPIDESIPTPVRLPALPHRTPLLQGRQHGETSSGAACASTVGASTSPVLPPAQPRVEPSTATRVPGQGVVAPGSVESGQGTPQIGGKSAHSTPYLLYAFLHVVFHRLRRELLYVMLTCIAFLFSSGFSPFAPRTVVCVVDLLCQPFHKLFFNGCAANCCM